MAWGVVGIRVNSEREAEQKRASTKPAGPGIEV